MRKLAGIGATFLIGSAIPASAAVTISSAATQNMSCSGGVCAPTATDAVLNVNDLEAMLASGNVSVTTTGSGVQAKDIRIDAKLVWSSTNTLALDAYKSIVIERPVTIDGAAGVSLTTNDGGIGGEFNCGEKGHMTFKNVSSVLTINGTGYSLLNSIATLAAAIAANPNGNFALANSYDASADGSYASPPIPTVFSGTFDGLGNTIFNLTINDPTENAYVGLFAEIGSGATLANIRLANENVTGGSGSSDQSSTEFIGGLVGYGDNGTISHAFVSGVVAGGEYAAVGGLVGISTSTVTASSSTTSVSNGLLGDAGGLIGGTSAGGFISESHATGDVSGSGFVGGLVGFNYIRTIEHSYATGEVTGNDEYTYAGGLVGINDLGVVARSFATGAVACQFVCGGLAGWNGSAGGATISKSYATGNVSSGEGAGGLVGLNEPGMILDSYATGAVSGQIAGGLVCVNAGGDGYTWISRSFSAGQVTGTEYAGGLIGDDEYPGSLKHAYWDTTTSGITNLSQGSGNVSNDPGIKGLSNSQLQSGLPKGFSPKIWSENSTVNGGLPYLIDNPPPK